MTPLRVEPIGSRRRPKNKRWKLACFGGLAAYSTLRALRFEQAADQLLTLHVYSSITPEMVSFFAKMELQNAALLMGQSSKINLDQPQETNARIIPSEFTIWREILNE